MLIYYATLFTLVFIDYVGNDLGPLVSTVVSTVLVLIFSEITPKALAKEFPEKFALFVYPYINFIVIILSPFTYLFEVWRDLLLYLLNQTMMTQISSEEIITMVEEAQGDAETS